MLFISLSVGHLSCFCLLAIMINAAETLVCKYLSPCFQFFRYIPTSEIVGSYVILCFIFEEPQNSFPQWLHHFTFLPVIHKGFEVSISSPPLVIFCVLFKKIAMLIDVKGFFYLPFPNVPILCISF